jgi:hypothetical protein
MTATANHNPGKKVEPIFGSTERKSVTDELRELIAMLAPLCPKDSIIRFEFDGELRLHLDVRRFEDLAAIEMMLPRMMGGIFHDVQRGISERHSFFHRLTAIVDR